MFWMFLLVVAVALTFSQLGAMAVMLKVLYGALILAMLVILGIAALLLWRKLGRTRLLR